MSPDESQPAGGDASSTDPHFEDPEAAPPEFVQGLGEDEQDIAVGAASRALDEEQLEAPVPIVPSRTAEEEPGSDVAAVAVAATPPAHGVTADITVLQDYEREVHDVIVELKRIESDLRTLIEERDPRRKRKLSGTHRWHELEEDILTWRFTGRFDEDTLRRTQELIARRHHLFRHLRFLAGTRPVWNS